MKRKILPIIAVGSTLCMALTGCVKFSYKNPAKADTTTEYVAEFPDGSTVEVTQKEAEEIKEIQEEIGMTEEALDEETEGETEEETEEETPFNISTALGSQKTKKDITSLGVKYTIYENGAEITGFENENGVIQEEVEYEGATYPVISLNLYKSEFIKTLEIPSHIKYIRKIGIYGEYLESLVIPETVEYIAGNNGAVGDAVFVNCQNLKTITFLGEFETDSKWVGTFANCHNLQSAIAVPEGVTELEATFKDCRSLVSVSLPNSLKTIGQDTFGGCESLTEITIPDSVTEISNYAFAGAGIKRIDIPESVARIGLNAFKGCNELEELYFPDSVTDLWGMDEMKNLKKVRWSNNAKFDTIVAPKLELMIFPDNTENIKDDYFDKVEDKSKLTIQVPAKTVEYFQKIFPEINVVAKE